MEKLTANVTCPHSSTPIFACGTDTVNYTATMGDRRGSFTMDLVSGTSMTLCIAVMIAPLNYHVRYKNGVDMVNDTVIMIDRPS